MAVWLFLSPDARDDEILFRELEALDARLRFRSRWLPAMSVEVDPGALPGLRELPAVASIRPVGVLGYAPGGPPHTPLFTAGLPESGNPAVADSLYGELGAVLDRLQIPAVHDLGFMGAGLRVGILDGSFLLGHATVRARPPLAQRDFVDLDGSVAPDPSSPPGEASHGTALWSLVAGELPFVLRGSAPGADVVLARIRGPGELARADEDRWVAGLEWMESQGVRVVLSGVAFRTLTDVQYSLEDLDGDRPVATAAADEAARRGLLVVAPVGNGGPAPGTLEAPADGDSVVAVGAVDAAGQPASFSARGPTGDGRRKPELLAPGEGIPAASASGDDGFQTVDGTEMAGALVAGGATLLMEAYPQLGPMEILEILQGTARPLEQAFGGVPRVATGLLFPQGVHALPLEEVDAEGRVTSLAPQFRWEVPTLHPQGLPVTFHLVLAQDSSFSSPILVDSLLGAFARRPGSPLPSGASFFWRVEARSVQGISGFSGIRGPLEVPPWVTLEVLNDPGGTELAEARPEFQWSALPLPGPGGPLTFELQVLSEREGDVIRSHPGLQEEHFRPAEPLPFNLPMRWRIIARAREGMADTVTSAGPFAITSQAKPPVTFLYQNFPNPFPNPEEGVEETRIWFDLARRSKVELAVYDIRGRLVRRLIPGPGCGTVELDAGEYGREEGAVSDPCVAFRWDGLDERDREVPRGVYLLRLQADGVREVRRMILWR